MALGWEPWGKMRRAWRSRAYLEWVRNFPCCACNHYGPSEAHHMAHPDLPDVIAGKGTSQKLPDQWVVPLCRVCHQTFHDTGTLPERSPGQTYAHTAIIQLELLSQYVAELDRWSMRPGVESIDCDRF